VGIARTGVKDKQSAVDAEIAKAEDLSVANWDTAAELAKIVARHPGAATPFTPEYIDEHYPAYRAVIAAKKASLQQVSNSQHALVVVMTVRSYCLLHVSCACCCHSRLLLRTCRRPLAQLARRRRTHSIP